MYKLFSSPHHHQHSHHTYQKLKKVFNVNLLKFSKNTLKTNFLLKTLMDNET